jgi:telomere length regulation protein
MASSVALVFSKVIDPKNPLYLDDSCTSDIIDWEFGLATPEKGNLDTSNCTEKDVHESKTSSLAQAKDFNYTANNGISRPVKSKNKKLSEFKFVDPDEIIDPVTLNMIMQVRILIPQVTHLYSLMTYQMMPQI